MQIQLWKDLNMEIGKSNELMIKASRIVLAVLDGSDIDSGVASEIGYAYALGKKIIGYRSDTRLTGDNIGAKVNLQIEYFIYNSGGQIVTNIQDLKEILRKS
jgi:nucleoside 2-deoxyribosyltransferase